MEYLEYLDLMDGGNCSLETSDIEFIDFLDSASQKEEKKEVYDQETPKEKPKKPKKKPKTIHIAEFLANKGNENCDEEQDVLFIDINAKEGPVGTVKGEKISRRNGKYDHLEKYKNWRRMLSGKWTKLFKLDDYTWNTPFHYIQAKKFDSSDHFFVFTAESKTKLSQEWRQAEIVSKTGLLKGMQMIPKTEKKISINKPKLERLALYAQFSQNPQLWILLKDTKNACLVDKNGRRLWHLENVRKCLNEIRPDKDNSKWLEISSDMFQYKK